MLIVGGGPAGTAAAIALAQAGERPLLLERARETGDAVCGGFLSWETVGALGRLGIAPEELGSPVTRLRLFAGAGERTFALPAPGRGVSRRHLDRLLLARAVVKGARVERGITVRGIGEGQVRLGDGTTLTDAALLLATGKHDLRGSARPASARGDDPSLGLRIRLAPSPVLDRLVGDAIELHLFHRGYAGIVRQEDGSVNVCMAVRRSRLREAGDPARLLAILASECPRLGDRLARCGGRPIDAIANVPYGWRARDGVAGLFRLGDQAAVIPSLAGEGIGIALASGVTAARALLRGGPAAAPGWQRAFSARAARPLAAAGAIRSLAERPRLARATLPLLPARLIQLIAGATRIDHDPT